MAGETQNDQQSDRQLFSPSARKAMGENETGGYFCSGSPAMYPALSKEEIPRPQVLIPLLALGIYAPGKAIAY